MLQSFIKAIDLWPAGCLILMFFTQLFLIVYLTADLIYLVSAIWSLVCEQLIEDPQCLDHTASRNVRISKMYWWSRLLIFEVIKIPSLPLPNPPTHTHAHTQQLQAPEHLAFSCNCLQRCSGCKLQATKWPYFKKAKIFHLFLLQHHTDTNLKG